MKTINELREKAWYRFIKVIYLFIFLIILSSVLYTDFKDGYRKKLDNSNSYILCDNGAKVSLSENNIYLEDENDKKNFIDIKILCGAKIDKNNLKLEDVSMSNYKVVANYKMNWFNLLKSLLVSFIIIFLSFEIIRRVFYYIILGSIRPKR